MAEFSEMHVLDVWYAHIDMEDLIPTIQDKQTRSPIRKRMAEARHRNVVEHDFPKLAEVVGRLPEIKDNPPSFIIGESMSTRSFSPWKRRSPAIAKPWRKIAGSSWIITNCSTLRSKL